MIRSLFIALVAALLLVNAWASVDEPLDGLVFQNGFAHRFNLSDPKDPNKVVIAITGNPSNGWITFNLTAPHTFCIPPTNSCGRDVQDTTIVIRSRHGQLSLHSLTNNPSPFSFGIVSDYFVAGYWRGNEFHMLISYNHIIMRNGAIAAKVPMKSVYAGTIDKDNVFVGHNFGFVPPYLATAVLPYQYLITYGVMNSSNEFSMLAGYRVVSPLGTAANPQYPAAPIDITGTVTDTQFVDGLFVGKISIHNTGGLINLVDANFFSDYHRDRDIDGLIKVNVGIATDSAGNSYFLDNLNILLNMD
jgi:hypothetical protein